MKILRICCLSDSRVRQTVSPLTERGNTRLGKHTHTHTEITAPTCSPRREQQQTFHLPWWSYLRRRASAGGAGRVQAARRTSFWLPGAFPSSPPPLYTRPRRLKVRGRRGSRAAVTLGNCTPTSHQRLGAAAHPDHAVRQRGENGRLCGTDGKLFSLL